MANLQSIMAETSKSYDNSRNALNQQIDAIAGDLEAQKNRLNAQYAQQSKSLENQRNQAISAASMNAARTGGGFGGMADIANDKYYKQVFTPAVTQLQTNQANDLSAAETQANADRRNLQQTLAQLNDEASRYGIQRYDAAVQAERDEAYRQAQLALQRQQLAEQQRQFNQQLAAQQAYQKYLSGNSNSGSTYKNWDFGGGYSVQEMPNGQAQYLKNGNAISAGDFLEAVGPSKKWNLWNDIWNNGVSTKGVGSDTVAYYGKTFNRVNPSSNSFNNARLMNDPKYSYLYNL